MVQSSQWTAAGSRADKGTKFLVNGAWDSRHDYRNYPFALDMMRK